MLKRHYDTVIAGKSYVSILFGIIQMRQHKHSTVIINDKRLQLGKNWCMNIGELEKRLLQQIGEIHGIDCLKSLDQYIEQTNTILLLNEKMIELGASPFSNIKELSRKLPECFSKDFIRELSLIDPEEFDQSFTQHFTKIIDLALVRVNQDYSHFFQTQGQENLENLYQQFLNSLKNSSALTKQLHYILQVLFQTIFSNTTSDIDSRYLLTSILSPRYYIQDNQLTEDLLFAFRQMGGDYKETEIQDWEIPKDKLEYILLKSYEGLIGLKDLYVFGHFSKTIPFSNKIKQTVFKSINITYPIDHQFVSFFQKKRMIYSAGDRMGTDFPHWEMTIKEDNLLHGTYSYADYEGTKPSFYYRQILDDFFKLMQDLFPGISKSDWSSQIQYFDGEDIWLENVNVSPAKLSKRTDQLSILYDNETNKAIKQLHYCGPLRTRSLGFFSYLLDVVYL